MASLTITVPDDQESRVLAAFNTHFGFSGTLAQQRAHVKQQLVQYVRRIVKIVEERTAVAAVPPSDGVAS